MTRPALLCLVLVTLPLAMSAGLGQTPTRPAPGAKRQPSPLSGPKADPKAAKEPGKNAPKESPRLQKLKQLTFDRRPSSILKAWAPQPPEPKEDKKEDKKPEPFEVELSALQRHVTLGNWPAVKAYLAGLPEDEGKAGYQQLLNSLQRGPAPGGPGGGPPGGPGGPGGPMAQYAERNQFSPDDLVGLAASAPRGLDKDTLGPLGGILGRCLDGGAVVETVVARLRAEIAKPAGAALTRREAARLLAGAGQAADIAPFLPSPEVAEGDGDVEALNLIARQLVAKHARENKLTFLEQAWEVTQAALALKPPPDLRPEQEEALRRAVELAPKLKAELGETWLGQSFTHKPERGMAILAAIGERASKGLQAQPHGPEDRLKTLELQKTALEALLKAAPERAKEWRDTVTLLGAVWLREAEFTHQFAPRPSPQMRRDPWGNIFFSPFDDDGMPMAMRPQNPNQPKPIGIIDLLTTRPGKDWLAAVRADLRPKLDIVLCQLHLKADEEKKAFPYIERLARAQPRQARELVKEFLRVWTRNHDPNDARRRTNPYMFMFGFERRAEGIPLTRSKQERNLVELADWVKRLRKLPLGEPDEELLAKAFTSSHSSAEVYRKEAIEKVFGPLGGLKPKTLSALAQQMRENLGGVWRKPEEQKDKKTNRKTLDIQAEVKRGYAVARATVEDALKKFPDDWSLVLARAALIHDELNFLQELQKSTSFAPKRNEAYTEFARAAKLYAGKVKELREEGQSTLVYEQWFYASLGAVDLGQISEERVPDLRQPARVRAALQALPGEASEKHLKKFANQLFTRMSAIKPQVKFRYLKGGFEIVGDHKDAAEAKKIFDYYKDLVTEIKLEAKLDGPAVVGHKQPFGVLVQLRHTREIERESGGFGRYLQNQNTGMYFSYNFGRPTADYRDRFQTAATEALKEHFEVLSVTFETDKVHSRADAEYGWRVTPYAYLLLKARGPQVDKLPPVRLDLDFLDTSGYVVLPVETPPVPLDARPAKGEPRPVRKLEVTQTLDERQAAQGKLVLDVKATGTGLVPELERVLDLSPEGFEVVKTQDQGVSVARFHPDSDTVAVQSERSWQVTLRARPGQEAPRAFRFGKAKDQSAKMVYQRYNDADLVSVGQEVSLEEQYGRAGTAWVWWAAAGGAGLLALGVGALVLLRRPKARSEGRWRLPEPLTPFTALGLLERIRHEGRLTEGQHDELVRAIHDLERRYFAASNGDGGNGHADLRQVTEGWLRQVK
jgi:hypothetical protein